MDATTPSASLDVQDLVRDAPGPGHSTLLARLWIFTSSTSGA